MTLRALLALAFVAAAGPALAHPPPLGIGGVPGGVLHPFFVPAHALAIVGLGLLVGQQETWGRAAPFAAIAALIVGLAAMTLGYVPMLMSEALLVLALVTGGLVALARPLPKSVGCGLGAAIGFAVALNSPPEVVSVREANLMLIGTGFGATILLILAVEGASRLKRPWLRIGARILGSWIAASAILVLASRFVR